jgi:biopolymer transport protein TolR
MAFSMAGGGPSGPQINVTPLIDVLLTLIVMFMLVVAMDKEYQEKAQIPQPDQKQTAGEKQSPTIVIQVVWTTKDAPPTVKINREDVRWEDVETRLAQIYLTRTEKVAFVRGDADVDFQYVADVIDLAHHAGVHRVGLLMQDRMVEGGSDPGLNRATSGGQPRAALSTCCPDGYESLALFLIQIGVPRKPKASRI